jgi:hypothetical protein
MHTVWQAVYIPFDGEFKSEQNCINTFKWKSKIDYEKFRIPSVGGHVQTLLKLCVPLFSSVRFRIGAIFQHQYQSSKGVSAGIKFYWMIRKD